jgi:hypothetical protein
MRIWTKRMKFAPEDMLQITINNLGGAAAHHLHVQRNAIDALPSTQRWRRIAEVLTSRFGPQVANADQALHAVRAKRRQKGQNPVDFMTELFDMNADLDTNHFMQGVALSHIVKFGMDDTTLIAAAEAKMPRIPGSIFPDLTDTHAYQMAIDEALNQGHGERIRRSEAPADTWSTVVRQKAKQVPFPFGNSGIYMNPQPPSLPAPGYTRPKSGDKRHHTGDGTARLNTVQAAVEESNRTYVPP